MPTIWDCLRLLAGRADGPPPGEHDRKEAWQWLTREGGWETAYRIRWPAPNSATCENVR